MLWHCIWGDPQKWELFLLLVLFSLRDTPQDLMKYSPFELQALKKDWEQGTGNARDPVAYWQEFQRIRVAQDLAKDNMQKAQHRQKERYDVRTKEREFEPGQRVLVLLPTFSRKLLTQWQGPFEITHRVGPADYKVHRPGHLREKQIYHVNLLQKWNKPEEWAAFMEADMEDFGPQGTVQERGTARTEAQVQIGEQLSTSQRYKMHYTH